MSVYDEIGLRRVINASGSMTGLGGSLMAPEVVEKMAEAARSFVFMPELMAWAGGEIARLTGTEAGLVTTGTAGGILLASAACLTGMDRQRMRELPRAGERNEFVAQTTHRIGFDHAIGVAGGRIVEVGGPQGASAAELAAAITERTAAVFYVVLDPKPALPLAEVAAIAHERNVPVIVDAAAELPPVTNLSAFFEDGADIILFSGGKEISGPNDTGILCGRRDLVQAAAAQAFPNGGIGRPMKVSKEQIVALVFALRRFASLDWEARMERWQRMAQHMVDALQGIDGVTVEVAYPQSGGRPLCIPRARLAIDASKVGRSAAEVDAALEAGEPAVSALPIGADLWLNPQHLEDGEEDVVVQRVSEVLSARD
jgi:L-seryl-tRNA(Ser) seleniumtransferase